MMAESRKLRVLLVEDDVRLARQMTRALSRRGHGVRVANTLAKAQVLAEVEEVDVVLLDLVLPDGRSEELIPAIRQNPNNPAIIVISGYLDAAGTVGLSDDCELVLPKPYDLQTLYRAIDSVTGDARLRRTIHGYCEANGLTSREEEALLHAVNGLGSRDAADAMEISEHTLRTHWDHILQKTEHPSQRDVVAAAMRFSFRLS